MCNRYSLLYHEICDCCLDEIMALAFPLEHSSVCPVCHKPQMHDQSVCLHTQSNPTVIHLFPYTQQCKQLIIRFKKVGIKRLAHTIAYLMESSLAYITRDYGNPVLVPVPCSKSSRALHGWDHMELVASSCEKNFGIPVVKMLQKEGRSVQKELDRSQRMESARHSFNVVKNFHLPEKRDVIVVLDDVSTTGATIRSCVEIVEQTIALPVVGLCITMD